MHVLFLHDQNRDNPTLEEHIWMLLRIFNTWKTPGDLKPRLMPYITMTCFPKMLAQINHSRSQLYLKVFREVKLVNIFFSEPQKPATESETRFDMVFLDLFTKTYGRWPRDTFPCLHKLATSKDNQSFQLYNRDTCREFHVVVKSIIESFQDGLSGLNSYRKFLRGDKDANTPTESQTELLLRVNWYGHLLRRLCAGAALRMHLENINVSLAQLLQPAPRKRHSFKKGSDSGLTVLDVDADADVDAEDSEVDEGNFVGDEESDEESEESAAEHQAPWSICLRWLKLLIAQFIAANNLVGCIAVPNFPTISAKILQNTPGSRSLMEWKELLTNTKYFPKKSVVAGRDRDNASIISSLERAISGRPHDLGSRLEGIQKRWQDLIDNPKHKNKKVKVAKNLIKEFRQMEKSLVPGCQELAEDIRKNIEKWLESSAPDPNSSLSLSTVIVRQINNQIDAMLNMCYIFSQFNDPAHFSGTVHCEANLANYLACLPSLPYNEALGEVEVGYLVLLYNSYSY